MISVKLDIDKDVLLALCLAAHDSGITLNDYVNSLLRQYIESVDLHVQEKELPTVPTSKGKKKIR